MLAIPSSGPSAPQREIRVDELLSYARFISRTTVPPTFRKPLPEDLLPKKPTALEAVTPGAPNGTTTKAEAAPEDAQTPAAHTNKNVGITNLNQDAKDWLDPLSKLDFVPWPSQDVIQSGALADIQRMREAGKDPASVLSAEEQVVEDERKKVEEAQERLRHEEMEQRRMSRLGEAVGRRGGANDVFDPDEA